MNIPADIEVKFEFNNQRRYPVASGVYRPHHLVKDDYMTTGLHHYYDVAEVAPGSSAYGTITFLSPESYPHTLYIGKRIQISEGERVVGYATVLKIFNTLLKKEEIQNRLELDFFFEHILLAKKLREMSFCFHDQVERFLGIMKEKDKPYWIGLCDIKNGVDFETADKLLNAKVYGNMSLKERWDEISIISIDALSLEEWLKNVF